MTRLPGWPQRLATVLVRWHAEPFRRGVTDCATFAATIVDAECGTACAPAVVGTYDNLRGALRWMRARNMPTLVEVAEFVTGNQRRDPATARAGDLVWFNEEPPLGRLAVQYGPCTVGVSPIGLAYLPVELFPPHWCIPVGAV